MTLRVLAPRMRLAWRADSEHERQPLMRVFLSQNVSRAQVERTLPEELHRAPITFEALEMLFEAATDEEDPAAATFEERVQHACINIDIFVRMTNLRGESCLNQAGSVRVPLYKLLGGGGSGPAEGFPLVIPSWGDPNANGANRDAAILNDKGTVWFDEGVQVYLPDGARVRPLLPAAIATHEQLDVLKADLTYRYCIATVRFFREHDYTWRTIADVNAFVYRNRAGQLPACAYVGARVPPTGPDYFERAARLVFKRHGIQPDAFDWANDPRGPRLLARVLTLSANLLVYVPDLVYFPSANEAGKFLRRTLESFDYARARGGGDCEDMALEIILNALELAALDARSTPLPPIVRGLVDLSKRFVKCMVLGGVSSAEISGDFASAKGMGAHMYVYTFFMRLISVIISISFSLSSLLACLRRRALLRSKNLMPRAAWGPFWACNKYGETR